MSKAFYVNLIPVVGHRVEPAQILANPEPIEIVRCIRAMTENDENDCVKVVYHDGRSSQVHGYDSDKHLMDYAISICAQSIRATK